MFPTWTQNFVGFARRCRIRIRCRPSRSFVSSSRISMRGQPPIVWDEAEDIFVFDKYGNRWLDWSFRRAGHQRGPRSARGQDSHHRPGEQRVAAQLRFPQRRTRRARDISSSLAPEGLEQSFPAHDRFGSDRVRHQARARTASKSAARRKSASSAAERGFHGRTLGSQQAGGMAGQKGWIVNEDPAIIHGRPFPTAIGRRDTSFDPFLATIEKTRD